MVSKKILIVDDEKNLASTLARVLSLDSNGIYDVSTFEKGEDALNYIKEFPVDLLICDYRLPGITGLDLLSHLRRNNPLIRTILMTGYGTDEVESQALQVADAYINKPFNILDILNLVKRLLSSSDGSKDQVKESKTAERILILEDDFNMRNIYKKAFRNQPFIIDLASSLKEARRFLDETDYKIFLCDIHVGREKSTTLLQEYKSKLDALHTQVVMVSAYDNYRNMVDEMGADFFLEKPISIRSLMTIINRLLEKQNV